jgi:hypothetical protein
MNLFVQSPEGSLKYTFEWADAIPTNVVLDNVTYNVGNLTLVSDVIDNEAQTSTIQLSGITHGSLTVVTAVAQLSNSELVPDKQLVIRGFNG